MLFKQILYTSIALLQDKQPIVLVALGIRVDDRDFDQAEATFRPVLSTY